MAETFSRPSPIHMIHLHKVLAHLNYPFTLRNFLKFQDKGDVCETSTILESPFGMKVLQHLTMSISLSLAKSKLKLMLHVSASSKS